MTMNLSAHVHLGRPFSIHGLALVPLFPALPPVPHDDVGQAVEAGRARVEERASPTVSALCVKNIGPVPLLVPEGSLLIGGMQDRISLRPAWIPARTEGTVPVQCVEARRWKYGAGPGAGFRASRADPGLRHARMQGQNDQQRTWALVAERRRSAGLSDEGGSVHELRQRYGVEELARDLALPWGASGVVVAWGHAGPSRFPLIEWSASPEAFRASWPALGQAVLDSHLERQRSEKTSSQPPWVRLSDIAALLAKIDHPAEVHPHEVGPEAQALCFRRGSMVGWATKVSSQLVHVGAVRV